LVTSSSDGRKTVYAITEDGRAELAADLTSEVFAAALVAWPST
jgi:DNA-binding PadR family transcriptional regulator